jgi:hypothetical protein
MGREQSFAHHARYVRGFHGYLMAVLVIALAGSVANLTRALGRGNGRLEAATLLLVVLACALITWYTRIFPLRAQDRAIRAEENLRHYVLTGRLLDERLRVHQVVALRFASDGELPDLARRAAEESLAPADIKRAITSWRADHYRV